MWLYILCITRIIYDYRLTIAFIIFKAIHYSTKGPVIEIFQDIRIKPKTAAHHDIRRAFDDWILFVLYRNFNHAIVDITMLVGNFKLYQYIIFTCITTRHRYVLTIINTAVKVVYITIRCMIK